MQLVDVFDDLAARFLLNLPHTELSSLPRFCFQVEEAQWFYEDFIRPMAAAKGTQLPNLPLRQFSLLMFQHCPIWNDYDDAKLAAAYDLFLEYKVRVPVRGAILLDESMERCVLVKGYKKGANWSFPRGKINIDEPDLDCAIREVYEETGFNVRTAGLVPTPDTSAKYIDITMREQHMRMFVFKGVPLDTYFEPQTRKEISKVQFYSLRDLPGYRKKNSSSNEAHQANKFYMVAPFLGPLKKWINQQKRASGYISTDANQLTAHQDDTDDGLGYHIPEVSKEEKSEAIKELVNAGAVPESAVPRTILDPNTYDRSFPQASQSGHPYGQPHSSQRSILHMIQPQSLSQPSMLPSQNFTMMPPAGQPPQYSGGSQWTQPPSMHGHSMPLQRPSQQYFQHPIELSAISPQASVQQPPQYHAMQRYAATQPQAVPEPPNVASLRPPQKMLLQLLSAPKQPQDGPPGQKATIQRPSEQASKLLDLFKSPSMVPSTNVTPAELSSEPAVVRQEAPSLPISKTRPAPVERKSTLNEFTRTLPAKISRPKSDAAQDHSKMKQQMPRVSATTNGSAVPIVPSSGQVSDAQRIDSGANTGRGTVKITRNDQGRTPVAKTREQRVVIDRHKKGPSTPKTKAAKSDVAATSTFTILARPQTSDAHVEARKTDTQELALSTDAGMRKAGLDSSQEPREDKLLALLGGPIVKKQTQAVPAEQKIASNTERAGRMDEVASTQAAVAATEPASHQNNLLKLFGGPRAAADAQAKEKPQYVISQPPTILVRPDTTAPAAPVMPADQRRPSEIATTPQDSLLGLFKQGTGSSPTPETPISPFALGSPEVLRRPQLPATAAAPRSANMQQLPMPGTTAKRSSVSTSTPTETRGFLLDYLNGVVKSEGNRG